MKAFKKFLIVIMLSLFGIVNFCPIFNHIFAANPYDEALGISTDNGSLKNALNGGDVVTDATGAELFNNQVLQIIGYAIDIFIVIGIVLAFIGAYKIMTSSKEDATKDGIRLVVFGILGIIIMVSAKFLATSLVGDNGIITEEFNLSSNNQPNGIALANNLYNSIIYPFIKIALYLVIGVLFFIMAGKVIGFVTATDDSIKKKAGGVIIWCVIGILIIMGSKQVVEAVMGNQNDVLEATKRIDEQGNSILEFGSIPLIAQVINWVMGLTMFIIVVLIIIQGYKMFTKPDDPKNRESLKKTLLYIIIGVLVIGAAYAISSILVVNNVPVIES